MAEELKARSVTELKNMLRRAGVDYSDCFEKGDLIEKVLANNAHLLPDEPKTTHNVQIGELNCSVVQNSSTPDLIVVLCHGFGANAMDLVPIAERLVMPQLKGKVKFVFPNAPMTLPQGGLAWWPIDLQKLMMLFLTGQIKTMTEDIPEDFIKSSDMIRQMITVLAKEHALPLSKFVVGGFSQGAMVSIDICLKLDSHVGALVPWSGGYVNAVEWKELAKNKKGLKVHQTHGMEDQLIPFQIGVLLKEEIFNTFEFDTKFISFKGGHTIPEEAMQDFLLLLQQLLDTQSK